MVDQEHFSRALVDLNLLDNEQVPAFIEPNFPTSATSHCGCKVSSSGFSQFLFTQGPNYIRHNFVVVEGQGGILH